MISPFEKFFEWLKIKHRQPISWGRIHSVSLRSFHLLANSKAPRGDAHLQKSKQITASIAKIQNISASGMVKTKHFYGSASCAVHALVRSAIWQSN